MKYALVTFALWSFFVHTALADPMEEVTFEPDNDNNGVRDDVDTLIAEEYGTDSEKVLVATTYARNLQKLALNWHSAEGAKEALFKVDTTAACWLMISSDDLERQLLPSIFNTFNVTKAYLSALEKGYPGYYKIDEYVQKNKAGYCSQFGDSFKKSIQ